MTTNENITSSTQPATSTRERCFFAWLVAAALLAVGAMLISASNQDQASGTVGLIGGVSWLAAFPIALVGVYYLIKAAVEAAQGS